MLPERLRRLLGLRRTLRSFLGGERDLDFFFGDAALDTTGFQLQTPLAFLVDLYIFLSLPSFLREQHLFAGKGGLFLDLYFFVDCLEHAVVILYYTKGKTLLLLLAPVGSS